MDVAADSAVWGRGNRVKRSRSFLKIVGSSGAKPFNSGYLRGASNAALPRCRLKAPRHSP